MPMMPATPDAVVSSARIDQLIVLLRLERAGDGGEEARPAGARLELHLGGVERQATAGAGEDTRPLLVVQRARPGTLGAFLAHDVERLGRQALAPLVLRQLQRLVRRRYVRARGQEALPIRLQLFNAFHGFRRRGERSSGKERQAESF